MPPRSQDPTPRRWFLLFALAALAGAGSVPGKDIRVSAGASPGGDGSANMPFDTIQEGVDAALAGDRVVVGRGLYTENVLILGRRVDMLAPEGPFQTAIDGGGVGSALTLENAADSLITGFGLTNGQANFGGGIEIFGGNPTISHCYITGNSAVTDAMGYGGVGGGIDVYLAPGAVIRDSLIAGNTAQVAGGGVNIGSSNFAVLTFSTVVGNTTTQPSAGYGSGVQVVYGGGQEVSNTIIASNSGPNGSGGFEVYQAGVTIVGNILHGNAPLDYISTECASPPCSLPIENQVADPRFVDGVGGNYRLRLDSPGIDAAHPVSAPSPVDLDRNVRPIDSDMDGAAVAEVGCFEQLGQVTNVNVSGTGLVTWDPAMNPPNAYHVYRAGAPDLLLGDYGICQDARDPDLTDTQFDETDDPAPGELFTFLVSFTDGGAEASLGLSTAGDARIPSVPCP